MTKISDLTAITTLAGTEEFVVAKTGTTRKIAASDVVTEVISQGDPADLGIADVGNYFTSTNVEDALQEIGSGAVVGAPDPVFAVLGSPDTAFEFNTSSLSGLTAIGSPDVEDADTTVPGHYFLQDDDNAWVGRYVSATPPFTAVTELTDKTRVETDGYKSGLFVGDSSPALSSDADVLLIGNSTHGLWLEFASSSNIFNDFSRMRLPVFLGIRVNSSTDIDYLFSENGYVWKKVVDSRNPSLTIATCGLALNGNGGIQAAAFNYLRIWNSAVTFPGVAA